ncbi:MAG: insulinase family protein [Acidobacteria bacterium]|nr:insulinase family protein [Acidobacteriota bacterium]
MTRRTLLAAALALGLAAGAFAQALPDGVKKVTSVEGITEYSLPDGLRVLLFPDPSKPKLTVNMTYMVGSRHEGYGETGMAHLLEHVLFLKTKTRDNVKQDLTNHGAQWNGSTWYDRTNYFETVTASDDNLKWAIGLEADRMVNALISKEIMEPEMTVVRNEFEMGENSPERMLYQRTLEAAYTFHNYGKSTIGARSDIEHVPYNRLQAFYEKYYQPDNAMLMISGQFDPAKALAYASAAFAAVPKPARVLDKTYTEEPTQDGERIVRLRRVGDVQGLIAVYHAPAATHPDAAVLEVLAGVLGETPSGRLYKALVDNKKAVSADLEMQQLHDPGYLMASVRVRKDQSLDEARNIMVKSIEGLVNEPPSKEEVERAKARLLKQIDLALTNSEMIGITMSEYASAGDWRLLFVHRDGIKKTSEQDVLRVAKAYLKESNRTIGEFIPTAKPDRAEIPAAPDVAVSLKDFKGGEEVQQGEAFDTAPANIESRLERGKLANGMKLALLPKKTRGGVVVAYVNLHYGDEKSLFGKTATAQLAGAMLMRGTKSKSRQQIQDEMDKLKAQINVSGGVSGAQASIQTTEANLPAALRLAAEILREPSFPDNEFETVRGQRLAGIESMKSEPQMLAQIALQRHMSDYPRGDVRHVGPADEQIEDLKKPTLDDARNFYKEFYGASNSEFVVSGQFDPAAIKKLAAELFGDWKSPKPFAEVMEPYRKAAPANQNIETPDKKNAMYLAALKVKMTDDDPDYAASMFGAYMLGGSPASRAWKRIRDKEGFSYGVGTQLAAPTKDDSTLFVMYAICNPQNTPKVEASFKDELATTLKDGFTEEEFKAAKAAWLDSRKVARSQDSMLVRTLASREFYQRTMKWDEQFEAKVMGLTLAQVNETFRKRIDPDGLAVFKAGDFKKAGVLQN